MPDYRLVFDGQIQPRASRDRVRRRLADLFQVSPEEIETLFSRTPVVLKENLDHDTALKDKADFEATGALCRIEAHPEPALVSRVRRGAKEDGRAATAGGARGRRFGLLHPYYLSFFSRAFYADVIAHWRGLAFVHLLLLMTLSAAVYTLHFRALIDTFVTEQAPGIVAQVPDIVITNGKVQVDVQEPYIIRVPESEAVLAVIDTTGEITSLRQTDALLLLTANRLMARLDGGDSRVIDLRQIESLRIDRQAVSQWLMSFQQWAPFILFPLSLGVSFVLRSLQAMLYGGIGLVMAAMNKLTLPYGAAVSAAIMAMTPFLILDALLLFLDVYFPLWGLGGFLLAMAYLLFGIRSAVRTA